MEIKELIEELLFYLDNRKQTRFNQGKTELVIEIGRLENAIVSLVDYEEL